MAALCKIAMLLGTDPLTLVVLGALSAFCAYFMSRVSPNAMSWLLYWPALMAGGLIADDAAVAMGIYELYQSDTCTGLDITLLWAAAGDGLQNVLLASTFGMCVSGLALLAALRIVDEAR
ncbi:MAG: hypothetical protein AB7O57_05445 [Hyphomicrobiaceae bacterium]